MLHHICTYCLITALLELKSQDLCVLIIICILYVFSFVGTMPRKVNYGLDYDDDYDDYDDYDYDVDMEEYG